MKRNRIILSTVLVVTIILYCMTNIDFSIYAIYSILAYLIVARVITLVPIKKTEYRFSKGKEARPGEDVKISLFVENKSYLPVLYETVEIKAENLLTNKNVVMDKKIFLMPKQKKTIFFNIKDLCCGFIKVSVTDTYISDPFKLFKSKFSGSYMVETNCILMPNITDLDIGKEQLEKYDMESYRYSQLKKGDDPSETFGIKTYQPGDNIKAIHWKLSGKIGEPVIREYGLPIDNRVFVIGDKKITEDINHNDNEVNELTELYCSVLYTLGKSGIRFSTGWYDYNRREFLKKDINCVDDVYDVIPYILSCPMHKDELSTVDHFLEGDVENNYGLFICVTNNTDISDLERLREYGEVNVYRPENFK